MLITEAEKRRLTEIEEVAMPQQERDRLLDEAMNAEAAGNSARADELLRKIPVPAGLAMELKKAVGSDIMRSLDLNYAEAEARYGLNWLQS
jgi:hypothetical protein